MAKDIREHLVDSFMRGFRAAVAGEALPQGVDGGAFAKGYDRGQHAVIAAVEIADIEASIVLRSPAMAQARANAEGANS